MCGITGIYNFEKKEHVHEEEITYMNEQLAHRGPDGNGVYIDKNVGLGHRRLSIIDIESGKQPMSSADKRYVIVFNGEIYNYLEIKGELKKKGYKFKTSSDTEVLLNAYVHWGRDCLNHLNGMWAFALWDTVEKKLFLARDRLGEKPLFYVCRNGTFIFASEIKSILANKKNRYDLDLTILSVYLSLSSVPAPYTFFTSIVELEPGYWIEVTSDGMKKEKYWDLPVLSDTEMIRDKKYVYQKFNDLLISSVQLRMRSDVPFGAFLSGGLDSGSIVSVMSSMSDQPVQAYTVASRGSRYDESSLAGLVAGKFECKHTILEPEPLSAIPILEKISHHFDQPFGKPSAIPAYIMCQAAGKNVKMILAGDGGDEVLSGYPTYKTERAVPLLKYLNNGLFKSLLTIGKSAMQPIHGTWRYRMNNLYRILDNFSLSFDERLKNKITHGDPAAVDMLVPQSMGTVPLEDYIRETMSECVFKDPFYRRMYYDLKVLLPSEMLTKMDRMSMAHSLEVRLPFLDYRLVEFLYTVDKTVKMPLFQTKTILRETIGKRLPGKLLNAPKKGLNVPLREWLRTDLLNQLRNEVMKSNPGLNISVLESIMKEHSSGRVDRSRLLWSIFTLSRFIGTHFA